MEKVGGRLAQLPPGPRDRRQHHLGQDELRFLTQIRRYSSSLNDSDRKLVLAMVKKMAATVGR